MSLLGFLKKKEQTVQVKIQQANATLYPDQILIATEDKTIAGFSIITSTITKLPVDATAESIGQAVRKHLSLSKTGVPAPSDFKSMYEDFLNAAGFKNTKAHHKSARHLVIDQKDETINVTPTINGGATGNERGFLESKVMTQIHVNASISDKEFGEQIRDAWLKCSDNTE